MPNVSWRVRHPSTPAATRQLQREVEDVLHGAFPEDAGYCHGRSRLSGAVSGHVYTVERGDFRVRVSLQRYVRDALDDVGELRLVGRAESLRLSDLRGRATARFARARTLGQALAATLAIGAFLALMGSAAHTTALVLSPVWIAAWVPAALLGVVGGTALTQALTRRGARTHARAVRAIAADSRLCADVRTWRAAVTALTHQRELMLPADGAAPFRSASGPARALQ